jgi:hypothetical protein
MTDEGIPRGEQVRRAVLPWRRRIRNVSRFDFTPAGGWKELWDDPFGWVILFPLFPLWLPAVFVAFLAGLELVCAVLWLPVAMLWRKLRSRWPVELLAADGRLLHREYARNWYAAGDLASRLRRAIAERDGRELRQWLAAQE